MAITIPPSTATWPSPYCHLPQHGHHHTAIYRDMAITIPPSTATWPSPYRHLPQHGHHHTALYRNMAITIPPSTATWPSPYRYLPQHGHHHTAIYRNMAITIPLFSATWPPQQIGNTKRPQPETTRQNAIIISCMLEQSTVKQHLSTKARGKYSKATAIY